MSSMMSSQGSPLSPGGEVLGPEATKAADDALLAKLMAAPAKPTRGRPPGSRNKPKTDDSGNFVPPGSRGKTTTSTTDSTDEAAEAARRAAKVAAKKRLADEYEAKILQANTQLFSWLIQGGIPPGFLFKNGQPPNQPAGNPNWTDLAHQIAIPPHLAKMAGLTAAELQSSTIGTSIFDTIEGDSPIRLIVLIGGTLLVAVPYLRNLNEVRKRLTALMEAQEQYNREQNRSQPMPSQGIVG
jgi:hypothetical protein